MKKSVWTVLLLINVLFFSFPSLGAQADALEEQLLEVDDFLEKYDFSTEFGSPVCYRSYIEDCVGPYPCDLQNGEHMAEAVTRKNGVEYGRITTWSAKSGMRRNEVSREFWEKQNGNALRFWVESQWQNGLKVVPRGIVNREEMVRVDGEKTTVEAVLVRFDVVDVYRLVAEHDFILTKDLPGFAQVISHEVHFADRNRRGHYELTDFDNNSCR